MFNKTMDTITKKWLFIAIVFVAIGILIIATIWVFYERHDKKLLPVGYSPQVVALTTSSTPITKIASNEIKTKTYRNAEWGFEFQYPENWVVKEKTFGSYYSKFNLEIVPPGKIELFDPIVVNIVSPEFTNHTFLGLNTTNTVSEVDGVSGIKYEYEFEGLPEVDIVLPLKENKMIIGTKKKFEYVFNQIVSTFKFLK
ncbi:hypothetical protein A2333_02540 [Candidatus Wolfebacteria bacterium RIFOXYB2_FULL_49_7]|nr:MAG: hypothetical protein A2333_02540 [Candidatus Wolfebacteria bacterium RIFOXYB2_FULL_49_7]